MTGPGFAPAIASAVADLTNAGVHATANAADVRFPGVWVGGISAIPSTLGGEWDYTIDLYLVDQTDGDMRTYVALDELAAVVASVFPLTDDRPLEVTSVSLTGMPTLPAYKYPITITE